MNLSKKIIHKLKGILKNGDGKKIIENFLSLSLIRIADFILPLIVLPYLITVLGVEKFGLTAFAAALVNYFLNITQYGFSLSAVRDLSKNQDNPQKLEEIFNSVEDIIGNTNRTLELKKELPYLPDCIGVVTSPTGAVIRDILHRLDDRFPRHVLLWPANVQGDRAAEQIIAGIEGFNSIQRGGNVPRPDLLIIARGGGSLEDLWVFNEEAVVRAAAASNIPLISAIGHETDTTLIDFVSDKRAPTPSAAAATTPSSRTAGSATSPT